MHMLTTLTHHFQQLRHRDHREAGTSMVEYVGLGAVGTMLVSGIAAALDGHAGDRIATAIVKRIIEVISN